MLKKMAVFAGALALGLVAQQACAKATAEEAAQLGKSLTPIGAEAAGNKQGTIPAWTPEKQHGALKDDWPNDPKIDAEKPLFTITRANMGSFTDKLSEGHRKLLATYADYKLNIYPTHRIVGFPAQINEATEKNALTASLIGTDEPQGATLGFPFPIPKSGAEVIWNHKLKWRGDSARRYNNQMIVQPNGDYQATKIIEEVQFDYANLKHPGTLDKDNRQFLRYLSHTVAPPRLAGTYILVIEKASTGNEGRAAWLYSPGLKRIRRAPTVCCDNPYEGTDGNQFYDQVDMFNGALDRYNWKLIGKKEMFIPYNNNKIAGNKIKYKDMIRPHHLNQDLPRYELHRVWVVEATLKPGTSHTFKKRVMYVDEDSWNIVMEDDYDNRNQLFQYHEGELIFAPNIMAASTVPEVIYHFDSGRYFITAAMNEDHPVDSTVTYPDDYFTASSVQKMTTK